MKPKQSLKSMTGYATTEGSFLGRAYQMDLRSLNHRFLEIKMKLPKEIHFLESRIRTELKTRLSRGTVDFRLDFLKGSDETTLDFDINEEKLISYFKNLVTLKDKYDDFPKPKLRDLLSFPDVVQRRLQSTSDLSKSEGPELFEKLKPDLERLISELETARKNEGLTLQRLFEEKIELLKLQTNEISEKRQKKMTEIQQKVATRISEIYEKYQAPSGLKDLETRIASELALVLEKSDITEEVDRLNHHINHFLEVLYSGTQVGKKLEFIIQEMFREINTIGSKAQDFGISQNVVQSKGIIEQMKEQVLNTE